MRKIKFRAKSKSDGRWVYGSLLEDSEYNHAIICTPVCVIEPLTKILVDSDTVGQFVGLYDADGKEVYEGDVFESVNGVRDEVVLDIDNHPYAAGFITRDVDGLVGAYPLNLYWVENKAPKVIGNIHDNPELLTKSK